MVVNEQNLRTIKNPELVFGIVGPIGVNVEGVIDDLKGALEEIGYTPIVIHLTEHINSSLIKLEIDNSSYFKRYKSLITYGNEYRRISGATSAFAGLAVYQIRNCRSAESGSDIEPALGHAYIIRQFKRAEEVQLMRDVYGRKFIQISVFGSEGERRGMLMQKIQNFDPSPKQDSECEREAMELIEIDNHQLDAEDGQRVSEVFPLGDVFVDGFPHSSGSSESRPTVRRFIRTLFGENKASPTKDEYGLYMASTASLRSADLSRQVGAAICTELGEVIALGCNEVPKAGGGTYWTDDSPPICRDIEMGRDANQFRRNEIFYDLVERMGQEKFLSSEIMAITDQRERVQAFLQNPRIKDSQLMDIIEFGRMIHAEMAAISDAARLGRSVKGATLFCTTFPCHMCAKHIVAAGIKRVVFLEPYPKSYAHKLHSDSITFDPADDNKVLLQPFIGISPSLYRSLFQKGRRKNADGTARQWNETKPAPLVEGRGNDHINNERSAIFVALKGLYGDSPP